MTSPGKTFQVNPDKVIEKLSQKVAALTLENAQLWALVEEVNATNEELRGEAVTTEGPPTATG